MDIEERKKQLKINFAKVAFVGVAGLGVLLYTFTMSTNFDDIAAKAPTFADKCVTRIKENINAFESGTGIEIESVALSAENIERCTNHSIQAAYENSYKQKYFFGFAGFTLLAISAGIFLDAKKDKKKLKEFQNKNGSTASFTFEV